MSMHGKVAVVTGGAMGIGAATALQMAAAGAAVIIGDVAVEPAAQLAEAIGAGGGEARAVSADVRQPDEVERLIAAAVEA